MRAISFGRTATIFKTFIIVCTLLAASVTTAFAIDLETARNKGLIGEVDNGYIAIPPGATQEAKGLVESVNQQRRAVYADIAAKTGISSDAAGQRTFEKRSPEFPVGTWMQMKGVWSKK